MIRAAIAQRDYCDRNLVTPVIFDAKYILATGRGVILLLLMR